MRRAFLICALLAASTLATAQPALAASRGVSEATQMCRDGYGSYGFRNVGECVSFVARGGQLVVSGPAQLTLIFEGITSCANGTTPTYGCMWSVEGTGLLPGSTVIVGGAEVEYGAEILVSSAGTVAAEGIYVAGSCASPGFESPEFIARGTAADGSIVESETVVGDYLSIMDLCPA